MTLHAFPRAAARPLVLRRTLAAALAALALLAAGASAQIASGPDWIVCHSLPSQTTNASLRGEYSVRDVLVRLLDRLQNGDRAALATYTLSGASMSSGAAGPILSAVSRALDRGAAVHFAVDRYVKPWEEFLPGLSLRHLARRKTNPMALSQSPRDVMMHHKAAIFDFGGSNQWTFVGSGNFTSGANSRQWNVAVAIRNPDLHRAFAAEMEEFRQGRFGKNKRRDHDRSHFRLQDSWGTCWVRFGPYPPLPEGSVPAETDVRRILDGAEEEIYFAMHHFNRAPIRRALVAAAERGVRVRGVIPLSDRSNSPLAVSRKTANQLLNPSTYSGTNRVLLLEALASADDLRPDAGEPDLVHGKYLLVDPNGPRPFVVHGAANWTTSGVFSPKGNDESILFIRHRGIAQAFLAQFLRMTSGAPGTPLSADSESGTPARSSPE